VNDQRQLIIWLMAGCVIMMLARIAYSSEDSRRYTFLETTGSDELSHSWYIQPAGNYIETRWISPDRAFSNRSDETGNTMQWRISSDNADITAWRVGNSIRFDGKRDDADISQSVEIDDSPWFQSLSYALGEFSQSRQDSVEFWFVRPDNLDVVKMRATRVGNEEVITDKGIFHARKVRISVSGFLSPFWKAFYWFRDSDGLFVRYHGVNGPPGTPSTTILLDG
jgi:hypothetical protein